MNSEQSTYQPPTLLKVVTDGERVFVASQSDTFGSIFGAPDFDYSEYREFDWHPEKTTLDLPGYLPENILAKLEPALACCLGLAIRRSDVTFIRRCLQIAKEAVSIELEDCRFDSEPLVLPPNIEHITFQRCQSLPMLDHRNTRMWVDLIEVTVCAEEIDLLANAKQLLIRDSYLEGTSTNRSTCELFVRSYVCENSHIGLNVFCDTALQRVCLEGCSVWLESKQKPSLNSIRSLRLLRTTFQGYPISSLIKLFPKLHDLNMVDYELGNRFFRSLHSLENLSALALYHCKLKPNSKPTIPHWVRRIEATKDVAAWLKACSDFPKYKIKVKPGREDGYFM